MPEMPPQWQGSEDILLGRHSESEASDAEEDPAANEDAESTSIKEPDD